MPDAVLLAPLALGAALVVSGLLKLRSPHRLPQAFADLGVPAALSGRASVTALPWLEVVLGVGLLLPAPAVGVVAALATLLLLAYTGLLVGVVRSGREVDCDCFGGLGGERIGPTAVVRNVLLVAAGALTFVDAVQGHSLLDRLAGLGVGGWSWLIGAVLVATLVVTVVAPHAEVTDDRPLGIPFLEVQTAGGTVSLPELASLRPQLLVTLSTSCSQCEKVTAVIGSWPARLPELDVRVLTAAPPDAPVPDAWPPGVLHDPQERVAAVLGLVLPSAVLLGADALVAGGPVHGAGAVLAFVEEIRGVLAAATEQ